MNIPKSFGLKVSGIYCITNIITNKIYIGSSKNIYHRLKRHYSELCRGIHANIILQNSFKKHGKESFNVFILEEVAFENLLIKEQEYIDKYNPAYNITKQVIRNIPSSESRLKTSNTLKKLNKLGLIKPPSHDNKKKTC